MITLRLLLMIALRLLLATMAAALVCSSPVAASAQGKATMTMPASGHPRTDAAKVADALRGGPTFVTEHATIMDWPASPGGVYRVLRQGNGPWTCFSGVPGDAHDEPGCYDPVDLRWLQDSLAGREPHIHTVGISYMYGGKWVLNKSGKVAQGVEFHVGPHVMVVVPHKNEAELAALSHDGSDGQPYVAHMPNGHDLYLVVPIRQWPKN